MKKRIKLMADYSSTGLWHNSGMLSFDSLPISKELVIKIKNWISAYNSFINWSNPGKSLKVSADRIKKFNEQGKEIKKLLENEIGEWYEINYIEEVVSDYE